MAQDVGDDGAFPVLQQPLEARLMAPADPPSLADDRAALRAAAADGVGLCTISSIEGSFSRRLGAQLAVHPDGRVTGSLADGCLERELAAEIVRGGERRIMRYGAGSPIIDFRLPCGGGLDILIDPEPERDPIRAVLSSLDRREPASLALPAGPLAQRHYIPSLGLKLFGEGPELDALGVLARTMGMTVEIHSRNAPGMALGRKPDEVSVDPWTAIVLLFHDHEWEEAILAWALETPAFFIGAQGGGPARAERIERLRAHGFGNEALSRITSPIGVIGHSREPAPLALSVLAQIVGAYEGLHPHR